MQSSGENSDHEEDSDQLSRELKGNTLIVYWFMIRSNKPFSAREIQRKVGLSSSSLSLHHLNKLIELGLVRTNREGQYLIAKKIRPGLLSLFIGSGFLFAPRFIFYAVFMTGVLLSSILFLSIPLDFLGFLYISILTLCTALFWIESYKLWKIQPI